jgi:hypothetical protein
MKILIFGDSFSADWSVKFNDYKGWPNLMAEKYNVTNIAQAGVSQYKIYKQLCNVNLNDFDLFIGSHTSPYRVPTICHPVHECDLLHNNADLIFADINYHSNLFTNLFDKSLQTAKNFFKYHYHEEFYYETAMLYRKEVEKLLEGKRVLLLNSVLQFSHYSETFDNTQMFIRKYKGKINHFTEEGNKIVYTELVNLIENSNGSST